MIGSSSLFRAYWKLEKLLVPGLSSSQTRYEETLGRYVTPSVRWLDLGCGRRLLPEWRRDAERALISRAERTVGVDLDFDSLRDNQSVDLLCLSSVSELPFADASFSLVTANMVMEHVSSPEGMLAELHRVLMPGGHLIFHTPNARAFPTAVARILPDPVKQAMARLLDGRASKDVFPTHYRVNDSRTIRRHAAAARFEVAELQLVSSSATFSLVLPLAFLELLWIRAVRAPGREEQRSNIIAVLTRP